jgi:hypothetical protein
VLRYLIYKPVLRRNTAAMVWFAKYTSLKWALALCAGLLGAPACAQDSDLSALARLDGAWLDVSEADAASRADLLRAREGAAMLATARLMYRSALARQESRGMHRRDDFPEQDDRQRRRDDVHTRAVKQTSVADR